MCVLTKNNLLHFGHIRPGARTYSFRKNIFFPFFFLKVNHRHELEDETAIHSHCSICCFWVGWHAHTNTRRHTVHFQETNKKYFIIYSLPSSMLVYSYISSLFWIRISICFGFALFVKMCACVRNRFILWRFTMAAVKLKWTKKRIMYISPETFVCH